LTFLGSPIGEFTGRQRDDTNDIMY
jgi:hypothetical protein